MQDADRARQADRDPKSRVRKQRDTHTHTLSLSLSHTHTHKVEFQKINDPNNEYMYTSEFGCVGVGLKEERV